MRGVSQALSSIAVAVLALVFGAAGLDKAFHYEGFLTALRSYVIVPEALALYLSAVIVPLEMMIALGLLVRGTTGIAAATAVALLLLFTVALGVNRYFDPAAPCGCWFTVTLGESTAAHIAQNVLLAGIAVTVCYEHRRRQTITPPEKVKPH